VRHVAHHHADWFTGLRGPHEDALVLFIEEFLLACSVERELVNVDGEFLLLLT